MAARYRNANYSRESDETKRDTPQTCSVSGKRMYASEREAGATATHRMADKSNKESGRPAQLRAYRCLYCMSWHLTSQEPSSKRKI